MAPQTSHREHAETLLERSATYAPSSAARLSTLAEAQVHATLALADAQPAPEKAAPAKAAPRRKAATQAERDDAVARAYSHSTSVAPREEAGK